ncbi:CoA transferase [Aneurinibacillus sp. Ricciae_BoGa-3]|uniref:CaiB/BaiF CoA transferase family protein n=1 Tax=Aneurinibacillus sp. Ricciae_BoGa-3 TaxID=3022697 RepID=UPI002342271E|nr:CoA transferase [Aneurinibacillus sp. Ricciae_BoGa-3]WCK55257.1 CoA transferase [Aneurinibacillus sp. Ricciae_BoGa-3]
MSNLPLSDIRVLELGSYIAGPFTGRLLADFGAEVIKVEPPDRPDPLRKWGDTIDGHGLFWAIQSRNKKCISLNLRKPEGQEIVKKILPHIDVVIENFRPGTLEKWNLGYEIMSEINPRLILVRTSGFGQSGPYKDRAGFGSVGEAMGGLRYVTGEPDRPPVRTGISMGDSLAALYAAIGCLTALHERERSGIGQVVDTALYEAVFGVMESILPEYVVLGKIRERSGNILPGVAPSNIYKTKDQSWIAIGGNADTVFKRLCCAMGQPELAEDSKYATHSARGNNQKELDERIECWTRTKTCNELLEILVHHSVPSGRIFTAQDMVNDPHFLAREMIINYEHPALGSFPMPGIVPKLSRTPGQIQHSGPSSIGQHNQEIFAQLLGLDESKLTKLASKEVI